MILLQIRGKYYTYTPLCLFSSILVTFWLFYIYYDKIILPPNHSQLLFFHSLYVEILTSNSTVFLVRHVYFGLFIVILFLVSQCELHWLMRKESSLIELAKERGHIFSSLDRYSWDGKQAQISNTCGNKCVFLF